MDLLWTCNENTPVYTVNVFKVAPKSAQPDTFDR